MHSATDSHATTVLEQTIEQLTARLAERLSSDTQPWDREAFVQQTAEWLRQQLTPIKASLQAASGAALVGHELRNPLAVICTSAELIAQRSQDPVVAKHSAKILKHAQTAAIFARDLLSAGAAMTAVTPAPTPLQALLEEAIEDATQRHAIEFEYMHRTQTILVLVDPLRTQQILANLFTNAAVAAAGRAVIALETTLLGAHVELTISDSSGGIEAARAATLFTEGETNARSGRYSLGLPLCRRLARLQGGDLELRSTSAQGSTFVLTMERAS